MKYLSKILLIVLLMSLISSLLYAQERQRTRELGIKTGILTPGEWNAITDVAGVKVGHQTVIEGDDIRTGVTAILPHDGNIFRERVPAAVFVGNGFGKALGFTQVRELGEIETPLALTNTLSIHTVANGITDYVLNQSGNEHVRSVNPVVGETNDGWLNDIRERIITIKDVYAAIENAKSGPVQEGNVGAGTGTSALGFKGGIGTSSRVLPQDKGGYTVGVLVQSNFGGILTINGAPVGEELNDHYMVNDVPYKVAGRKLSDRSQRRQGSGGQAGRSDGSDFGYHYDVDGSIMIIVATDAPITSRNLERLAKRAFLGVARVGGFASNGSGDYVISFSTNKDVRIHQDEESSYKITKLKNDSMTPLFLAAVEATEEAILNSLFMAESITGWNGHTQEALPVDEVIEILKKYNAVENQ